MGSQTMLVVLTGLQSTMKLYKLALGPSLTFWPKPFMQIPLNKYTQNKLFGNENKANDHTQQLMKDEKQNSQNLLTRKL